MVNEGRKRGDEPVAERGWRMVQHNVDRIATQSLDILSFAKQRTPQLRRVDLDSAFRDAVEGVLPRATAQGVKVESSVGPGAVAVVADPNLLAQVMTILLDNAVDACREDPSSGAEHRVRIASSRDEEWIRIDVADDGDGIDEENRERIFEDFFSTKGSMGTGLGLVVARKIVAEHGGTIDFAARPDGGTVFTVRLPEPQGGTVPGDGGLASRAAGEVSHE
jgi:signal transduction histidine kinase